MIKKHPIVKSKLYKLYDKKQLAEIIGCSSNFISSFINDRGNYKNRSEPKKNGGSREINNPGRELKEIHRRLLAVLRGIETPNYLKSGIKGISSQDVAQLHKDCSYMLCMDIKSFYQSARKQYVRSMFINKFKMAPNLADFLAKLVTIPSEDLSSQYIPTGSPISQLLIFWTYKQTFDDINKEAEKLGIKFSLYVDDMTFSSKNPISWSFESLIIKRLGSVKLRIKKEKTERFGPKQDKVTTGIKITKRNQIQVTDKNRKKIISFMKQNGKISTWAPEIIRKVRGMIISAQVNEPDFLKATGQRLKAELKKRPCPVKKPFRTKFKIMEKIRKLPVFKGKN